jgi:hypothetical protein
MENDSKKAGSKQGAPKQKGLKQGEEKGSSSSNSSNTGSTELSMLNPTLRFVSDSQQRHQGLKLVSKSCALLKNVVSRPVYIEAEHSDDYEVNYCALHHSKKKLTETSPVAMVVLVAETPSYPTMILFPQLVCRECVQANADKLFPGAGAKGEQPFAPNEQCDEVSLMELAAVMNTMPAEVFQRLLGVIPQGQPLVRRRNIARWFEQYVENAALQASIWKNRAQVAASQAQPPLQPLKETEAVAAAASPALKNAEQAVDEKEYRPCAGCRNWAELEAIHQRALSEEHKDEKLAALSDPNKVRFKAIHGVCPQCECRFYCSRECQKRDWNELGHSRWCLDRRGPFFSKPAFIFNK